MVFKLARGGKFMSCERFPECDGARTEEGAELKPDEPIGAHPESGEPIFLLHGRFGPYVQEGEKTKENPKPRRASVPQEHDLSSVTLEDAVKYLKLPRTLGVHPESGKDVVASVGRFGPYVVHDGDYRSLKEDDVYTVSLERALELLSQPKQPRKGVEIVKELGKHPKTGKPITLYKSKSGLHLKKGLKNVYVPDDTDPEKFTLEQALELLSPSKK